MAADGALVGTFAVYHGEPHTPGPEERSFIELFAQTAAVAIQRSRDARARAEQFSELQTSLLPRALAPVPGVEVAPAFHPATRYLQVGGDFYDVFPLGDAAWGFVIGDVCGHGAAAAAVTALTRHTTRAVALLEPEPGQVLATVNAALLASDYDRFCTAVYGHLTPHAAGASITLASGGHPAPLLRRNSGEIKVLDAHGPFLGVIPDPHFPQITTELEPGNVLLLYTDGLTERNPHLRDEAELQALLTSVDGHDAHEILEQIERGRARVQVLAQAAGNPMALIELAKVIADDPAASRRWAAEPLPLTDRLTALLASRFAALPEQTRAALLLAAVADNPDLNAAASYGAGPDARALALAEQLGLVKVDRAGLHFSHPLVRSAIYHSAPFAQRAAAHRELASALHDQPDRRAWHLAAAALHPDEHVASLLEATAAQAQRRGGAAAAALAMERAAELSPDPEDQARRLVAAASAAVPTGQGDWVQDLATRALAVTADPELRLTARHDAAWALAWSGRRTDALPALLSVAEEASRDLPALAWDALGSAATVAYQSGTPASRQAVSHALDLLERQGPPPPGRAPGLDIDVLRLWIRASADPIGSRNQLLPHLRKIAGLPIEEPSLWRIASAAWLLDESGLAITLLQDAMQRLRAPGVRGTSGGSLTVLGWAYIDTGRWDEALDVAAEAASLAEANQMELIAASADVITATVLALRADSDAARRHAARALATVDPADCGLVAARARRALGVAALADGSYLQAFTQLRGLFREDGTPLHNYASYLGMADLAAAAVRADRRIEGTDVIEHALSRLDGTASVRLEQLIARARGILAGPDGAEAHFDKALADPAGDQWPFERAQLRLDYAEWLRRRRRINDAKPVLTQALGTFRRLGAQSWAQRAQAELRASGVAVVGAPAEPDALGELTPQQRQIVRLASDGLTDREIGDRLFLSPRTVSSHLYRSYPKLGVASRHQLRDVIARAGMPATAHESTAGETRL